MEHQGSHCGYEGVFFLRGRRPVHNGAVRRRSGRAAQARRRPRRIWRNDGASAPRGLVRLCGDALRLRFHTATTLRSLGPAEWRTCYAQPCRRPADGRYGENPNRMQHYYQFQVLIKPSPVNAQELYLGSLAAIGLDPNDHDVRFVEDDWESPTLGAWGLGWEVWLNGMEVTQFTYFQQVGGIEVDPVPVEITYGLERIAMYAQGVNSVYDLVWSYLPDGTPMTYGDVFLENEREFSAYNFEVANVEMMRQKFDDYEAECHSCLERKLPLPAYDCVMKCSHAFNLLDARGALSAVERANYILRVRAVAKACCEAYMAEVAGVNENADQEGEVA